MDKTNQSPDASAESAENRKFLLCMIGKETFALDLAPVEEIIRVPDPVPVPLAPDSMTGLVNIRGRIIPLVSMRKMLGLPHTENTGGERAVLMMLEHPVGIIVDKVINIADIPQSDIKPAENDSDTKEIFFIKGMIRNSGLASPAMIPDIPLMLGRAFDSMQEETKKQQLHDPAFKKTDVPHAVTAETSRFVSFKAAGQEYAVPLSEVLEIVEMPHKIVQIPNVHKCIHGLMSLRNRFLPLVNLRILFGLPDFDNHEDTRIMVVESNKTAAGIIVDSVSEVMSVEKKHMETLPGILSDNEELSDITSVCRMDNGKRVVSVVSAERLVRYAVMKEVLDTVEDMKKEQAEKDTLYSESDEQIIVFTLNGGEFGVPIISVQEIVRIPENLTPVPKSPDFIEGVMNLRGTVVPVIDQRKRMGLPDMERNDRQRIMIFMIDGIKTGFIVDSVTEVLKIPEVFIEESPKLSKEQSRLLNRVANLDKDNRIIQIIDPDYLVEGDDFLQLKEMEKTNEDTYS